MVFGRRYRVTEKIGTGGMADVFKAVDEVLGRTVAVKVMHPRYAADPSFAARFRQEAQAAANLVSPNIVNMYDWGADGDTYYIVMEYVRGNDLKSIIAEKGALPSAKVADIGAQICSALSVAHGYDIVHRDIKPHNVMVQPDGSVKVMDFGIARAGNSTMTQTGSVLGTAHYVSPEQAQGKELTGASDLYSLGVVLYEAATGELPFDADTPVAVALKQVNEQPRPPHVINPRIDPGLEAVIVKAMQKKTADRYTSADEMRRDLLAVAAGREPSAVGLAAGLAGGAGVAAGAAAAGRMDETAVMPSVGAGGGGYGQAALRQAAPKKRPVWPWVLAAIALILAGVGAAWALGLFGPPSATVPDLTGKTQAEATALLTTAGFVPGVPATEFSDTVPAGEVISQSPPPNSAAKKGTSVTFTLSKGPNLVEVPRVVGLSQTDAYKAIVSAGLTPGAPTTEFNTNVPQDQVFKQDPAAGSKQPKGSVVNYVVSRGTQLVKVPDVTGMSESSATSKLKGSGFKVSTDSANSDNTPKGQVMSQDPSGGAFVPAKSTVTITISLGPANVSVPNLVGKNLADAKSAITAAKLTTGSVTYNGNVTGTNLVNGQTPSQGTSVKPGSTVSITIDGVAPVTP